MHEHACLNAELRGRRLQSRLQTDRLKIAKRGERFANGEEVRLVLRNEMLRDAFRVVLEIVDEIETGIGGQLGEELELALTGLERGADVISRKLRQIEPGFFQRFSPQFLEAIVPQLADIFAVEPDAFIEIERGIFAMDLLELEQSHHFIELKLFAVILGRPAEQTEIIADGFGEITAFDVSIQAG